MVVHWDSLLGAVEVRTPLLVPFTIINTVLELADFWFRHIYGMLLIVKENEAANPADVGALGSWAVVPDAGYNSNLIQ